MNDLGAWEVHPLVRVPCHGNQCQACKAYRYHIIDMDKESAEKVAEDMARLWGSQEIGDLRKENKRLLEERNDARAEIEELKKQLEVEKSRPAERKRSRSLEASGALEVSASEQENRRYALPGPTEVKFVSSPSDGIITQDLPVPTRRIGRGDIVGFGVDGVTILRTSLIPPTTNLVVTDFGYDAGCWRNDQHVRLVGDTTGDGRSDIIGFGYHGVLVARNDGNSFSSSSLVLRDFGVTTGWRVDTHVRYVADLRKKGYIDIIGFGNQGVFVSLNNGDGTFAPASLALKNVDFLTTGTRGLSHHFRFLADVNGDGFPDIVTCDRNSVFVALGNGDGTFAAPSIAMDNIVLFDPDRESAYVHSDWSCTIHNPCTLADLTGDGRADIINFGCNGKVYVALNRGDGTFQLPKLAINDLGAVHGGWQVDKHPRFVADVNGNGLGDIVGFGDAGVYVAIGNGDGTFQAPKLVIRDFGYKIGGWRVHQHPRFVVDLTGNGAADIIGFGQDAVWVSYNDGNGNFGYVEKLTQEFSANRGWEADKTVRWIANL